MTCEVWGEIIYPFPNLNGALVEVYQWISYFTTHFIMDVLVAFYENTWFQMQRRLCDIPAMVCLTVKRVGVEEIVIYELHNGLTCMHLLNSFVNHTFSSVWNIFSAVSLRLFAHLGWYDNSTKYQQPFVYSYHSYWSVTYGVLFEVCQWLRGSTLTFKVRQYVGPHLLT